MTGTTIVAVSFLYLLLLFGVVEIGPGVHYVSFQ